MKQITQNEESVKAPAMPQRELSDATRHDGNCVLCRDTGLDKARLTAGAHVFGLKNADRSYVHSIGATSEEAAAALGWEPRDVIYAMRVRSASEGGRPMSEETKLRLREMSRDKRHESEEADKRYLAEPVSFHCYYGGCKNELTTSYFPVRCTECGHRVYRLDSSGRPCYTRSNAERVSRRVTRPRPGTARAKKGGNPMAATLTQWAKEFVDSQVLENDKNDKPTVNFQSLFKLAKANGLDVSKYSKGAVKPENAGRVRMTVGNMIRGAANRNGKLTTLGGASKRVPDEYQKTKAA